MGSVDEAKAEGMEALMKAGDEQTRRIEGVIVTDNHGRLLVEFNLSEMPPDAIMTSAKVILTLPLPEALIEQESGEWVEIDSHLRVRPDGSEGQMYVERVAPGREQYSKWETHDLAAFEHYRKGREVALEQVRELVEAVEQAVETEYWREKPISWVAVKHWERIKDAAKQLARTPPLNVRAAKSEGRG